VQTASTKPTAAQPAPDEAPPHPAEAAPAPAQENPGLINEIGKLFDNPSSIFPTLPSLKSSKEAIDDFNARAKDAAKDATDGLSRLTTPLIVRGRVACPVAANGAPDCKVASDKLCQGLQVSPPDLREGARRACSLALVFARRWRCGLCTPDASGQVMRKYCHESQSRSGRADARIGRRDAVTPKRQAGC